MPNWFCFICDKKVEERCEHGAQALCGVREELASAWDHIHLSAKEIKELTKQSAQHEKLIDSLIETVKLLKDGL